jgi:hypothetical protein
MRFSAAFWVHAITRFRALTTYYGIGRSDDGSDRPINATRPDPAIFRRMTMVRDNGLPQGSPSVGIALRGR